MGLTLLMDDRANGLLCFLVWPLQSCGGGGIIDNTGPAVRQGRPRGWGGQAGLAWR